MSTFIGTAYVNKKPQPLLILFFDKVQQHRNLQDFVLEALDVMEPCLHVLSQDKLSDML